MKPAGASMAPKPKLQTPVAKKQKKNEDSEEMEEEEASDSQGKSEMRMILEAFEKLQTNVETRFQNMHKDLNIRLNDIEGKIDDNQKKTSEEIKATNEKVEKLAEDLEEVKRGGGGVSERKVVKKNGRIWPAEGYRTKMALVGFDDGDSEEEMGKALDKIAKHAGVNVTMRWTWGKGARKIMFHTEKPEEAEKLEAAGGGC